MGKGGQSNKLSITGKKHLKLLNQLSVVELRKWGKEYGVDKYDTLDSNDLIEELIPYAGGVFDKRRPLHNFPLVMPKFTLKTIRDAIPKELFKRSLFLSMMHLLKDIVQVAVLGYLATYINTLPSLISNFPTWGVPLVWCIYIWCQGCCMTGIWVMAHECGHQAFSESEFINNTIGTIFHSLLLVPYHPWRITHGRHHSNTGSCDNDEVFAPAVRTDWKEGLRETMVLY